ncbi:MAG: GTP diphosphokinase [Succinivibrionaceae bacterium]|nr:GTP diphosphokinase [Succinivibrionaceae bacterium]
MVALRDTHDTRFDYRGWTDALSLPQGERDLLHRTWEYVEAHYPEGADRHELERTNRLNAEMVLILVGLNMDLMSLQCALLYRLFDRDYLEPQGIAETFGEGMLRLLEATRDMDAIRFLDSIKYGRGEDVKIDKVRRMLLAMVKDVRAVVIKLAERIAVIRESRDLDEETRLKIAREVANIYAPLANRLGIGQLKWELEDLAFRSLHPDEYREIARDLGERRVDRERYIIDFVEELRALLEAQGIHCQVYGRPKHIYSIWRKMQRKHLSFFELYDVRAVRVIVERVQDCYAALGIVNARWRHVQREFDDYIANPKPNGYQSLHTVVYGDGDKLVEIQIRTSHMHEAAELGVAAHWKYKEGGGQASGAEDRINWLRKLLAWRDDMVASGSLLDEYRTKVFEDRVYVFTPQGEVVDLPTGSTPLDFAYHVHTMVGHRCVGAKVDGRIVPFTYALKTGQTVEIITQREPSPSRDWLNPDLGFLRTHKARSKVMVWFRAVDRERNVALGAEALARELARRGLQRTKEQVAALAMERLPRLKARTTDDVLAALGAGDVSLNQILAPLGPQAVAEVSVEAIRAESEARLQRDRERQKHRARKGQVIVDGVEDILTHMAHCCRPVPGDDIVGFITQGRGISIHRTDCRELKAMAAEHSDRLIHASWGDTSDCSFSATIRVVGEDYQGTLLRDVTAIAAADRLNVLAVRSRSDRGTGQAFIELDLMIHGAEALEHAMAKFRDLRNVSGVSRA